MRAVTEYAPPPRSSHRPVRRRLTAPLELWRSSEQMPTGPQARVMRDTHEDDVIRPIDLTGNSRFIEDTEPQMFVYRDPGSGIRGPPALSGLFAIARSAAVESRNKACVQKPAKQGEPG